MHRDWLIILLLLFISFIAFSSSYETDLFALITDYIKRLIGPISTGILP
ncbi:MAG TPA: hypothetical protein VKU94_01010 [Geobacterales bacterium]|nr:hypothetical protein [Geobacterales bacterium]